MQPGQIHYADRDPVKVLIANPATAKPSGELFSAIVLHKPGVDPAERSATPPVCSTEVTPSREELTFLMTMLAIEGC